jgi:hypothetical protein
MWRLKIQARMRRITAPMPDCLQTERATQAMLPQRELVVSCHIGQRPEYPQPGGASARRENRKVWFMYSTLAPTLAEERKCAPQKM